MMSKPQLKIPVPIVIFFGLILLIILNANVSIYGDTMNVLKALIYNGFSAILLSSMCITLKYRREIHKLSRDVDSWGEFAFLEKEAEEIRMNAKHWVEQFNSFYIPLIQIGSLAFCLGPLGNVLFLEQSHSMDQLIFPCWTPFPMDTHWGFYSTYFCQSVLIMCANLAFSRVFCYKIICLVTIGHQMRLIGSALLTLEQRVKRINTEKRNSNIKYNSINFTLEQEIKKCAMQFQIVYSAAKDTTSLFRPVTSVVYHYGMWVICASGVKFAREQQLFIRLQIFMLLCTILVNQYIYSVGSEYLKNEVEKLRVTTYSCSWYTMPVSCQKSILIMIISMNSIPSFNTVVGTQTNLENFGKILNGSYYYISLLLTILSD